MPDLLPLKVNLFTSNSCSGFVVLLFCCFMPMLNSHGHVGMVMQLTKHYSWAGLVLAINQYFVYILSSVPDNCSS